VGEARLGGRKLRRQQKFGYFMPIEEEATKSEGKEELQP